MMKLKSLINNKIHNLSKYNWQFILYQRLQIFVKMISQFIRSHKSSESEVGEDAVLMGKKKDSDSSELAELLKEINLSEKQYLNFGSIWRLV